VLSIGSLCSGVGMLDYAVGEVFGGSPYVAWAIDNDRVATHAMERITTAAHCADIAEVDFRELDNVDIITAGWPCQPWSYAGNMEGHNDHRAIWAEVGRAIRVLRPEWVVLENVPGILTRGEFDRVANTLADLGYDFRWATVRASEAGAPHQRARVFILGCYAGFPERQDKSHTLIAPMRPLPLLPTPCATDGERCGPAAGQRRRLPEAVLDDETMRRTKRAQGRWRNISRTKPPPPCWPTSNGTRRLNPAFAEWMMGIPTGWVTACPAPTRKGWVPGHGRVLDIPHEYALRLIGNAVCPQQAKLALLRMLHYRCAPRVYGDD